MKPRELKEVLRIFFNNKAPVMIVGQPGIGKTEIVKQVTEELGHKMIIMYPSISEPVDFRGMPTFNNETGIAKFVPFDVLNELIEATEPTICFMDDFGQANQSVQAACMHLFLERKIGDHNISNEVTFVICTNDKTHHAGVAGIIEPVKSRMVSIINLEPSVTDWVDWAIRKNLRPEVIGFMRHRGSDLLSNFEASTSLVNSPSPRGSESVSKIAGMGFDHRIETELVKGACGQGYATEFLVFRRLFDGLVDPMDIIKDPLGVPIDLSNASLIYAYCGAVSSFSKPEYMDSIVKFAERMPIEYQVKLLQYDCFSANEENHATEAYTNWALKNQDIQKAA